jgi:hypothetical protein
MPHGYNYEDENRSALMALLAGLNQGMMGSQAAPILFDVIDQRRAAEEEHHDLLQQRREDMQARRQEKIQGLGGLIAERAGSGISFDAMKAQLPFLQDLYGAGPKVRSRTQGLLESAYPMQADPRLAQGTTPAELGGSVPLASRAQVSPMHVPEAPEEAAYTPEDDAAVRGQALPALQTGRSPEEIKQQLALTLGPMYDLHKAEIDAAVDDTAQRLYALRRTRQAQETVGQRAGAAQGEDLTRLFGIPFGPQ